MCKNNGSLMNTPQILRYIAKTLEYFAKYNIKER